MQIFYLSKMQHSNRRNALPSLPSSVIRRDFLLQAAAAIAATSVTGVKNAIAQPPETHENNESPEARAKRFLDAERIIEVSGIGNIEWHHPTSHKESSLPINPQFLIGDFHGNNTSETDGNRADDELDDFRILLVCQQLGMKKFRFEGTPANKEIRKLDLEHPALKNPAFKTLDAAKSYFQSRVRIPASFKYIHSKTAAPASEVFALYSEGDCECKGAESPETYTKYHQAVREYTAAREAWETMMASMDSEQYVLDMETGHIVTVNSKNILYHLAFIKSLWRIIYKQRAHWQKLHIHPVLEKNLLPTWMLTC